MNATTHISVIPRRPTGLRCLVAATLMILLCASYAVAAVKFPALTGRVVDDAHLLSDDAASALTQELKALEDKTGDQLVVVTLTSLQGLTIEEYGVELGRSWGIGKKGKDNGVLLLVAPKDHKVRIEVGYRLEETITDAVSSHIIYGILLPAFRKGEMEQGIRDAADALVTLMGGDVSPATKTSAASAASGGGDADDADDPDFDRTVANVLAMLMGAGILYGFFCAIRQACREVKQQDAIPSSTGSKSSYRSSRSSGSSNSDDDEEEEEEDDDKESFSGGGGSFGGGGASGEW